MVKVNLTSMLVGRTRAGGQRSPAPRLPEHGKIDGGGWDVSNKFYFFCIYASYGSTESAPTFERWWCGTSYMASALGLPPPVSGAHLGTRLTNATQWSTGFVEEISQLGNCGSSHCDRTRILRLEHPAVLTVPVPVFTPREYLIVALLNHLIYVVIVE